MFDETYNVVLADYDGITKSFVISIDYKLSKNAKKLDDYFIEYANKTFSDSGRLLWVKVISKKQIHHIDNGKFV